MIDPKLNELPVTGPTGARTGAKNSSADAANLERVSAGTTLNDTVAANASLSTGGRGVDTSGVSAGAGAGAGMVKPNATGSTVPTIVPDARTSGTTPLGSGTSTSAETSSEYTEPASLGYEQREISARAYELWCERGCPSGSPEVDWQRAEREIRSEKSRAANA